MDKWRGYLVKEVGKLAYPLMKKKNGFRCAPLKKQFQKIFCLIIIAKKGKMLIEDNTK